MKNELITIILVLILIGIFVFLGNLFLNNIRPQELISPNGKNILQQITRQTITPSPTPSPTPIEYHFDKSTNLQKELDTINPKILDSDFDSLKTITSQL